MIRRYGEAVKAGQRYTHRPGAYVILPLGGKVLLTFQGGIFDEFQLPGGGIEHDEHPIDALHREVLEETGWRIAAPRKLGTYRRFCYMPDYDKWAEKLCHIYIARPVRSICPPTEPDHWPAWVEAGRAASLVASEGDRAALMGQFN